MELVITPKTFTRLDLRELWEYRALFYFFAWRDFKVRYKQTLLGIGWTVFQPLVSVVVFTVIFGRIMHVKSPNAVPYAIFSYTGLIFWTFFATALARSADSVANNQGIISKIHFPRVIVPLAASVAGLIDFVISLVVLGGVAAYYSFVPGFVGVLLLVPLLALSFLAAAGAGMLFAALGARYRDARQALPFLIQTTFFFTPVIYPISLIPPRFQWLIYLNPMAGVISVARSTLLHQGSVDLRLFAISAAASVVLAVVGLWYFQRKAGIFVDVL
ncbi:MAG: lipopolysaccharide transport system permease protein [Gaiellaceae bacterium]|jgi:lipopolysaccharide transport system permease protein|nr:lipopolysaccharide transport system permease protein [Gaiellaceae bacterium]